MAPVDRTPKTRFLEPRWSRLRATLDEARRKGALESATRDELLQPAELLDQIIQVARPALGWDPEAADRLATYLLAAEPYKKDLPEPDPNGPRKGAPHALVTHASLVTSGLATIRICDAASHAESLLSNLYGLVLAVGPAAFLARMLRPGATPEEAVALVHAIMQPPTLRAGPLDHPPARAGWRDDRHEVAQDAAIDELFLRFVANIEDRHRFRCDWPDVRIERIDPPDAWTGDGVELTAAKNLPVKPNEPWPDDVRVEFAAVHQAPIDATVVTHHKKKVTVHVPEGAGPGWIGFVSDDAITDCDAYRKGLVEDYGELGEVDTDAILGLEPRLLPTRTDDNRFAGGIPQLTKLTMEPSLVRPNEVVDLEWQTNGATYVLIDPMNEREKSSGVLHIIAPQEDGTITRTVTPGRSRDSGEMLGTAITRETVVRAQALITEVRVTQEGRTAPLLLDRPLDVLVTLDPPTSLANGSMTIDGRLTTLSSSPEHPGKLSTQIDVAHLHDQLVLEIAIRSFPQTVDDRRIVGPLQLVALNSRNLVVIRPTVLHQNADGQTFERRRVDDLEVEQLVAELSQSTGLLIKTIEPPWTDDTLAVLSSYVENAADPRVPTLLEELALAALRTPGFEDAVWLALVPMRPTTTIRAPSNTNGARRSTGPSSVTPNAPLDAFSASAPCIAARELLIANVDGALAHLKSQLLDRTSDGLLPIASRLRLSGRIDAGGRLSLDPAMQDQRRCTNGHTTMLGIEAHALDRQDQTMARVPLECVKLDPPQAFVALLPIADDVQAMELRRVVDGKPLARLTRYREKPSLGRVMFDEARSALSWEYSHPISARGELFVEIQAATPRQPKTPIPPDPNASPRLLDPDDVDDRDDPPELDEPDPTEPALSTTVLRLHPCATEAKLPLARYPNIRVIKLVATDGWNVTSQDVRVHQPYVTTRAIARRLATGEFWADVPDDTPVHWTLDRVEKGDEPILRLAPSTRGMLVLSIGDGEHREVVDQRPLGDLDAYDRP